MGRYASAILFYGVPVTAKELELVDRDVGYAEERLSREGLKLVEYGTSDEKLFAIVLERVAAEESEKEILPLPSPLPVPEEIRVNLLVEFCKKLGIKKPRPRFYLAVDVT